MILQEQRYHNKVSGEAGNARTLIKQTVPVSITHPVLERILANIKTKESTYDLLEMRVFHNPQNTTNTKLGTAHIMPFQKQDKISYTAIPQ